MARHPALALVVISALLGPSLASSSVLIPTTWARLGGQAHAAFGQAVAPAGDLDHDGDSELLVGAPGFDAPLNNAGAVYLFRGSKNGPAATPDWQFLGLQNGSALGTAVAPAGDVNQDGWADVLVGAPLFNGPNGTDAGRAYLFLGGPGGLPAAPSQVFDGVTAGDHFGFSLAWAGDVDGDGYDDVLVGAPRFSDTFVLGGAAYLLRGSPGGLVASPWVQFGGADDSQLGFALSGAGDVDADGYPDVVIGAPGASLDFTAQGGVAVYLGSAAGLAASPAATRYGVADSAAFGASVSRAGDVDGDGYADVLCGAPGHNLGGPTFGAATLFAGAPGGLGAVLWEGFGIGEGENFGVSVATAGDLDGDDRADFVVGSDRYPEPLERNGRVVVVLGAPGPPVLDVELFGDFTGQGLGFSVATAGDFDGDGFSDLAVGEPGAGPNLFNEGRVRLYRGSASKPVEGVFWPQGESEALAGFGQALAGGVDARRQGTDYLFVSAPGSDQGFTNAGKIRVATAQIPSPVLNVGFVAAGDRFNASLGVEMARAGDVNGDGYEDVLSASPAFSNGQAAEGRAQLFLGGATGLAATPAWSYESDILLDYVGRGIAGGDFNGDGYSDILVGGWREVAVGQHDGTVRVFNGSPSGPGAVPQWTSPPISGNTWFGFEVATGDWDADGYSDAAIGAPTASGGQASEGQVHVYFGGPAGLGATPAWILETNVADGYFGTSIANGGDIDGDGVGDLVIGAPGAFFAGRVYVFSGSRSRSVPALNLARKFQSDAGGINFGQTVAGIGDVDKDGFGDFLVGAPQYSGGQTNEGRVWLFRGSDLGGHLVPWWTHESNVAEALYGSSLARIGDANSDGWPDFAVGAPNEGPGGTLHVYQSGGRPLSRFLSQQNFATGYVPMGGLSPDPSSIVLVGTLRSAAGRVRGNIEVDLGTQNEAWEGSTRTVHGPFLTNSPDAFGSLAATSVLFPQLAPGVGYRWRSRGVTSSPYFRASPWSQPRAFETAELHFRTPGPSVAVEPPMAGAGLLALRAIEPSPFREGTRIRFRTPRAGEVRLTVHDARGRLVRRLAARHVEAGDHDLDFDGRDDRGHALGAGIYFVSLDAAGEHDVRKVVRLP